MPVRPNIPCAGFTLVELLVVVTIILILIALLVPAMERVQYEASMAKCLSNQRLIAGGALQYAISNDRSYPDRPTLRTGNWKRLNCVYDIGAAGTLPVDDRPFMADYIQMDALTDPMGGKIDLGEVPTTAYGFTNYELWFGTKFAGSGGLFRTNNRLSFQGQKYPVLVSDEDKMLMGWGTHCGHPDNKGKQDFYRQVDMQWVISRYQYYSGGNPPARGPIDAQHAFTDGSAHRYNQITWNEDADGQKQQMGRVPIVSTGGDIVNSWCWVPKS